MMYTLFSFLAVVFCIFHLTLAGGTSNVTQEIVDNAATDNIDFNVLGIGDALLQISDLWDQIAQNTTTRYSDYTSTASNSDKPSLSEFLSGGKRIDVHSHVTPNWYRALVPVTGGNPTPVWNLTSYISFIDSEQIDRTVLSFSSPAANVFQGNKPATIALARLMNEQAAVYCAAFPHRFKFFAVVPLPYVQEAITEARYALTKLGAAGILLTSNFEGSYLGNAAFKPFFEALDNMSGEKVFFIHATTPHLQSDNRLVEANPTRYPSGTIEFYFETARTLMDLTLSEYLHEFTSIKYIIPQVGGAFPSVIDRFLKTVPMIYDSSLEIYRTRFWWDSAGPTYYHQVSGLLGYEIPKSHLLFGTDFPYAPTFTQAGSLDAILSSKLLTDAELRALFSTNARDAFSGVAN